MVKQDEGNNNPTVRMSTDQVRQALARADESVPLAELVDENEPQLEQQPKDTSSC